MTQHRCAVASHRFAGVDAAAACRGFAAKRGVCRVCRKTLVRGVWGNTELPLQAPGVAAKPRCCRFAGFAATRWCCCEPVCCGVCNTHVLHVLWVLWVRWACGKTQMLLQNAGVAAIPRCCSVCRRLAGTHRFSQELEGMRAACRWKAHGHWIPFGDHPLKLERYRED